jgi:NNP family nitrate/nitrite transporter-like MFS transporter
MNVFARTLGGYASDRVAVRAGLRGRGRMLALVLLCEGILLAAFSRAHALPTAIAYYIAFSLFVSAACGATYAVVPMLNKRALGSIAGVVGAGGNVGAILGGLLFRSETLATADAFLYLGFAVLAASAATLGLRFSSEEERATRGELEASLSARAAQPAYVDAALEAEPS